MHCLFCKQDSAGSSSVEHIVPESFGNTTHVLPMGVVCDKCSNYFSREVEAPLLRHPMFQNLRAWHRVPTKRGRLPPLAGIVAGTDIDIALRPTAEGLLLETARGRDRSRLSQRLAAARRGRRDEFIVFPLETEPPGRELARFLAKMALEALAERFLQDRNLLEHLVDDEHNDRIRNFARRGDNFQDWPCHTRRIYPVGTLMRHPDTGEWVRIGYGYDLFLTSRPETYFVFCLYGLEFVLNTGGPSITGYTEWLAENNQISPVVERVGARLCSRSAAGGRQYFLEGGLQREAGVAFDRLALSE